jgi:hypothetical protein
MTNNPNAKNAKNATQFCCEVCDFKCYKKSNYDNHLNTLKHQNLINPNAILTKKSKLFECNCGKIYKHSSTLCAHKKKCNGIKPTPISNNVASNCVIIPELIVELIKDNKEMKQLMIEFCKNGMNNNSYNTNQTNNNINSNNKSFNLQFFLNETCKNAMNIMDFANSIQVKLTDLENIGELGYVDGISKIIIDNLKLLDVTQIPVHCSDFKREMMYVKDNDKWEKENDDKTKIKKLINHVANKNISLISEWKNTYPECTNSNSNKSTKINKMIMEVMDTNKEKKEKIINKIAKETTIDKEPLSDE